MAFEGLTDKLQGVFKKLGSKGRLTEQDVKAAMREVRMALLEADVNYKVVKDFVAKVTERAVGEDIVKSLTPGQQVIKIVNEELTGLMGGSSARLTYSPQNPTIYMLCGLQGAGKTTMAGKLGYMFKRQGKKPLLVACDVYRPAAIQQLKVVGEAAGVEVFERGQTNPVEIAKAAIEHARYYGRDMVIIDTAGRLHIDEKLMQELRDVRDAVKPQEILLVVDAMTGQDAVNVSDTFNRELGIDGIILTKLDGDTRGGAAISVKAVTGKPIKLVGTGEKLAEPEIFHPDRMASRILGMGDVLSLIEKAESTIDEKAAMSLERKMRTQSFTLEDYLEQMKQLSNMGSISDVLKMIPGVGSKLKDVQIDEDKVAKAQKKNVAIILSMTRMERRNPDILNASRKRRIAAGSGATVQDVNLLLKQFDQARSMMKQVMGMRGKKRMRLPFGMK
ncbi:MAG TPA: signal recognition particle protein [Candidatus Ornithocaccomicrobium faecavium]|uniref:Signal recognition particle protein n=1 Tax=Candidatus Ornithocaccomicrobium faecavium TaxID=2840890 RepID=A0A9D1P7N4_9FIRM|nr:signal recognition particle protein [Clostridiales bacterium]HIV28004.1 signal recognition particle protein [Candidatus Ornithocaccomicrobium faecavium]